MSPQSIPSPGSGQLELGPLSLNAYGLMIALGVVAAIWLFGRRLEEKQLGTRDDASTIGLWAVAAGVVGARLYHVVTDWHRFEDNLADIPKIWHGGLGIPGGLLLGIPVGIWMARRRGIGAADAATAAAPAIPLAQAIGRWGNWFNQELFGGATDLPWGLEIDDDKLAAEGLAPGTTVHPTFLYESLWNLALAGVLLWIDRRWRPRRGRLMAIYVMGYGVGRFWVEGMRIDPADELGPFRWNQWVAIAAIVCGALYLLLTRGAGPEPMPADDDPAVDEPAVRAAAAVDEPEVDAAGPAANDVEPPADAEVGAEAEAAGAEPVEPDSEAEAEAEDVDAADEAKAAVEPVDVDELAADAEVEAEAAVEAHDEPPAGHEPVVGEPAVDDDAGDEGIEPDDSDEDPELTR